MCSKVTNDYRLRERKCQADTDRTNKLILRYNVVDNRIFKNMFQNLLTRKREHREYMNGENDTDRRKENRETETDREVEKTRHVKREPCHENGTENDLVVPIAVDILEFLFLGLLQSLQEEAYCDGYQG